MNKNVEKITMLSKFHNLESPFLFDDYALCFGHFNVIHPGHLRYFQTAHSYKGKIVVALEGDRRLTELARGEWFTENERAQAVAALEIIDKVVILDSGDLAELVSTLKPALLILGREFEGERAPEVAAAIAPMVEKANPEAEESSTHGWKCSTDGNAQNPQNDLKIVENPPKSAKMQLISSFPLCFTSNC